MSAITNILLFCILISVWVLWLLPEENSEDVANYEAEQIGEWEIPIPRYMDFDVFHLKELNVTCIVITDTLDCMPGLLNKAV